MKTNKFGIKKVIGAIKGSGGVVSEVARRLKCDRATVYEYIKKYEDVRNALIEEREEIGDLCETEAIKLIKAGNPQMISFMLKTQYRNRGYTEKSEVENMGAISVRITREIIKGDE